MPRGGVGVELALDAIQLGVERKFGLVARIGHCSFHVRSNSRRRRRTRRIGLRGEASGLGASLRSGVARLGELVGELARAFGGLTARLVGSAGADFAAQLRKRQLDLYGLQILDRIGVENQPRAAAVLDRVGGARRNDYSNHRQFALAHGLLGVEAAC